MLSTRYSCQSLMKLEFSRQIFKSTQISNLTKVHPVGAELFPCERMDGRTDMTKLLLGFCNFCQRVKKLVDRVLKALMTCMLNVRDISPSHSYKCVSEHLIVRGLEL